MLDREVVERLKKKLAVARGDTNPFGGPFQVDDARHEILNALPELLRVYRAWLDAPVGHVVGQSGPDGFFPEHSGAIVQMDDPASVKGKRVRLVRDGEPGEG